MTPDPSITRLTLNGTLYAVNTNQLLLALLAGRKFKTYGERGAMRNQAQTNTTL